jgi:SAM-dependent methyltransferase
MDLVEVPGANFRRHPWEVARARFFLRLLDKAGLRDRRQTVLDVGAGDGYFARQLLAGLPPESRCVCFDSNYTDADLTRFASPDLAQLGFTRQPPSERFDLILLLDVIEHVEDDRSFLSGFVHDQLAPGGTVLVSVPAWPALFSRHDVALKHYRRYTPAAARELIASCGLVIRRSGGLFHSLLFPRAMSVLGERVSRLTAREARAPADLGDWRGGAALSSLVGGALAVDAALGRAAAATGVALPGLSFWALCGAAETP